MSEIYLIEALDQSSDQAQVFFSSLYSKELNIDWNFALYRPRDLDENAKIIYLFHGAYGNYKNILDHTNIKSKMDSWLANNDIPNTIMVFVDGFNSFYIDSDHYKMESALIKDFFPQIENLFAKNFQAKDRYLAGISMGGHGALRLGLKYPDLFSGILAISPALWYESRKESPNQLWNLFKVNGSFNQELWMDYHPGKLLGKSVDMNIKIITGRSDLVVDHENIEKFEKEAGKLVQVKYIEDGDHSWPFWDQALNQVKDLIR